MNIADEINRIAAEIEGKVSEKKGIITVESVIAERKAFLSKKRLTYTFKVRIDDQTKLLTFTEMLKEAGSGLSTGGGFEPDTSVGFGFKKETYNTMSGAREGSIEESSTLFGKTYEYKFDYAKTRREVETLALESGYEFKYQVLPIGF
ncbi:MAG: hypothetical protein WCL39_01630 [Armatimonadota bacterium]